jgi:hypothetical protein
LRQHERAKRMTITEDLQNCDWQTIIEAATAKHCHEFTRLLLHRARRAETDGDAYGYVYELIRDVAGLLLDLKSPRSPFRPEMEWNGTRTFAVEDLTPEQTDALRTIAPIVRDPEIRARICDLCWTLNRSDHQLGRLAIVGYLESAQRLAVSETPSLACDNITRAVQVAALIGRKGEQYTQLVDSLQCFAEQDGLHPMVIATILEQILEQKAGDTERLRQLAEATAHRCNEASDWWRERELWDVAEKFSTRLNDSIGVTHARTAVAESFLTEADALGGLNDPTASAAVAHRLEHGLHALRRIDGTADRQKEIHERLLASEFAQGKQMGRITAMTDISEAVTATRAQFRDVGSVEDALFKLALIAHPPRIRDLRAEVDDAAKRFPLQHLFERVAVDAEGKVIAKYAGASAEDEDDREHAIRAQMTSNANLHRAVNVDAGILPGVDEIASRMNVRLAHFEQLVRISPFIPAGHHAAFATGLYAGFEMRLIEAAHILVNQLEPAIRHVLRMNGVITSKFSPEGIQENLNLNELLWLPEMDAVFGEDLRFDLQGLLIERFGCNLRNRIDHGLLADAEFFSPTVVYLWWLTLRLCCLPLIAQRLESNKPDFGTENGVPPAADSVRKETEI